MLVQELETSQRKEKTIITEKERAAYRRRKA